MADYIFWKQCKAARYVITVSRWSPESSIYIEIKRPTARKAAARLELTSEESLKLAKALTSAIRHLEKGKPFDSPSIPCEREGALWLDNWSYTIKVTVPYKVTVNPWYPSPIHLCLWRHVSESAQPYFCEEDIEMRRLIENPALRIELRTEAAKQLSEIFLQVAKVETKV